MISLLPLSLCPDFTLFSAEETTYCVMFQLVIASQQDKHVPEDISCQHLTSVTNTKDTKFLVLR
jgi:hypothetical protein